MDVVWGAWPGLFNIRVGEKEGEGDPRGEGGWMGGDGGGWEDGMRERKRVNNG